MIECEMSAAALNAVPMRGSLRLSCQFIARRLSVVVVSLVLLTMACTAFADSDNSTVELGRYLATAGNCATCHTRPGGTAFAGGLPFATPFGTIYSTNITPDPDTGIGKWSEQEFASAMRAGVRPNGDHLYPAFPYTAFTKLSDADVAALFAYLRALPPANSPSRPNELSFPANQRWALGIWKALYFTEGRFTSDKGRSQEWNRGAYLVEGLGHCSSCHSPRNFLGAEKTSMSMTGGEYTDKVPGGAMRTWSAPNLTSAPNGLGSWPLEDVAAYLKTGRNSFAETFGPMNEVIMNSTLHLSGADVRAMAVYLKDLPAHEGDIGAPASEEMQAEGSNLYDVHCGTCHLPTGLGGESEEGGARLAGSPVVQASDPASLINVILHGPQSPEPPLLPKRWKRMEAFGDKLSDEEVAAIASFLRSAWGNVGGAVSVDQVAKQR